MLLYQFAYSEVLSFIDEWKLNSKVFFHDHSVLLILGINYSSKSPLLIMLERKTNIENKFLKTL